MESWVLDGFSDFPPWAAASSLFDRWAARGREFCEAKVVVAASSVAHIIPPQLAYDLPRMHEHSVPAATVGASAAPSLVAQQYDILVGQQYL